MTTLPRIVRLLVLAYLGPLALGAAGPRELDLSGTYDDAGVVVVAAPDQVPGVISLHAMLSLEFVPGLAKLLHDQTGQVRITHEGFLLKVEVLDRDDAVIWHADWKGGEDFGLRDNRIFLRLKPGRFGNDEYVLSFTTVSEHRLLQLEVQRLKPTFFGPVYEAMGTYLFYRI
ncbi:hypothetical protein Verru16b_03063 [Lacunisphaera limnophila]|uniref:Uncharacterized protein n=1 Tax=Lacunisphaera limnophila TaxID=1838286 RepID=A0A1D8AYK0_9BACT|nr:hypothetical protein [Lacunisphaera limnophila]AOS45972.1 hypothetical protein Verru16b_03063 [Lacunisphaera limnophila]